jgi:hypothetical protein
MMVESNPSTLERFGKTSADVVKLLGNYRYALLPLASSLKV